MDEQGNNSAWFITVLGAWTLAVLLNADETYANRWRPICPAQVAQAESFLAVAGERFAADHWLSFLTLWWAAFSLWLHQKSIVLLLKATKIHQLQRISLPDGDQIQLQQPYVFVSVSALSLSIF